MNKIILFKLLNKGISLLWHYTLLTVVAITMANRQSQ